MRRFALSLFVLSLLMLNRSVTAEVLPNEDVNPVSSAVTAEELPDLARVKIRFDRRAEEDVKRHGFSTTDVEAHVRTALREARRIVSLVDGRGPRFALFLDLRGPARADHFIKFYWRRERDEIAVDTFAAFDRQRDQGFRNVYFNIAPLRACGSRFMMTDSAYEQAHQSGYSLCEIAHAWANPIGSPVETRRAGEYWVFGRLSNDELISFRFVHRRPDLPTFTDIRPADRPSRAAFLRASDKSENLDDPSLHITRGMFRNRIFLFSPGAWRKISRQHSVTIEELVEVFETARGLVLEDLEDQPGYDRVRRFRITERLRSGRFVRVVVDKNWRAELIIISAYEDTESGYGWYRRQMERRGPRF